MASPVVDIAKDKLVTPLGLRTLSLDNPDFRPTYHGDFKTRDAAYHQGTVWAWLIGPFITPGQGRQLGVEAGGRGSHRPARQPTARDDGNARTTPAPVRAT